MKYGNQYISRRDAGFRVSVKTEKRRSVLCLGMKQLNDTWHAMYLQKHKNET